MTTRVEADFLIGGGEMAELIAATDWASTRLGPIADWPQSLKTATSLVLGSKFAMVVAWGPDFVFLYNDRYRPVLGGKHPAALGRPGAEIFPEVWDDIVGPLFRRAVTEEAIALDDVLIPLDRNGFLEECYFTLSYSPIRGEGGAVGGLLAVVAETTERVQAERGMRTLRDLAAVAGRAAAVQDALGYAAGVLAANPIEVPFATCYLVDAAGTEARRIAGFGLEPGSAGAPDRIALDDASAPWRLTRDAVDPVFVEGQDLPAGLPGGAYPEACRAVAILPITRPGAAHPFAFVVAGTCPRRALDERYRTFFELACEHIATGVNNARAHEHELRRAEELAALDRAKTAFFSNISHEFRTPLTLMLGPTEDALASEGGALAGDQLVSVHRNELRLLKLVNALLEFSRIEAGRIDARYRPTPVPKLTAELASAFRSAAERADLVLEVDCPPVAEPVWVDPAMWEKIVLNLISNALKFTFDGAIRVETRAEGGALTLRVTDTGTGIAAAELPRLFERFHRVQGQRSRTHEGSGIGLALVQELARLHGGDVRVDSEVGRGSTFTVTIPLGTAHLPADRLEAAPQAQAAAPDAATAFTTEAMRWIDNQPAPAPAEAPASEPRARVLVVDDNADMRDYLRRVLAPRHDVITATDGLDALRLLDEARPDVVVSDVMMPGLDGVGLVRELRHRADPHRLPVILLSARAGEESRVEGLEAGADDYLVKPFSARELLARVATQLDITRLHREARAARLEAEGASRAKDEFFAMLGHELRNPLTPIKTALHLIGEREPNRHARELAVIERQVDHMVRLVDDLLDVSRIASGKIELRKQRVELADLVGSVLEATSALFEQRRHELHRDVPAGLVVDADPVRLAQVITNLMTNAAKYTPSGGKVSIIAAAEGDQVVLRVRDNGVGIEAEMLPRVFELFSQERQSIARSDGGLGLGLAIVHSLVVLHGGTVSAHSEGRGHGTELVIRLPRYAAPPPAVVAAVRELPARPGQGFRILVVDDNVDSAELLAESLRHMGHDTAVAFDGPEAIRIAEGFLPQIALLDIGLPVMDGYELAQRLAASDHQRPELMVAISGYGLEADRQRSRQVGFDEHIVKPIQLKQLRDLLAGFVPTAAKPG